MKSKFVQYMCLSAFALTCSLGGLANASAPTKEPQKNKKTAVSKKVAVPKKAVQPAKKNVKKNTVRTALTKAKKAVVPISAAAIPSALALSSGKTSSAVSELPSEISHAMLRARVDKNDLSIAVIPLGSEGKKLLINANQPRIPASVEKIVTSAAALDLLGPSKVWSTYIASEAEPENGILKGNLYLIGSGDPYLTIERFWLLLDNLRARGIKTIDGDIILDRSSFQVPAHDPFAFDGEGNRPYNLGPDALLINSRSLIIKFRPDPKKGVAYLYPEPILEGIKLPENIPLSKEVCGAWRKQINPDYSNPYHPVFKGKYPSSCGAKNLMYTAFAQNEYVNAIFSSMWKQMGGEWKGTVKNGKAPEERTVLASSYSDPLTKLAYNMNKYSNNLIARQLFLALGKTAKDEPKNLAKSRETMKEWAQTLKISPRELYLDNGSGLSRSSQLSAAAAARVLEYMWKHKVMAEYMASMPISGIDGTMKKRPVAKGQAHIKTGYISGVRSIAGYVLTASGKRYAVAAIINGNTAINAIPVMDAIIDWVYSEC